MEKLAQIHVINWLLFALNRVTPQNPPNRELRGRKAGGRGH